MNEPDLTDFVMTGREPHVAIRRLLGRPLTPRRLQQFTRLHVFPLIEPGRVTFVWIGEAEQVSLLRWIHAGVDRKAFRRITDGPVWILELPVVDGGRFEYKLAVQHHGQDNWMLDPLNRARAGDPYGENSVCRTFGYRQPDWSLPQGAPAGSIVPFPVHSQAFEETRHEQVYLPAGFDVNRPYPLLVIHDGADFVTYADLSTSLDNLIAAGTIPPLIGALVQTGDRLEEYARGHHHARYLVGDLLPQLEEKYPLASDASQRVLLGASLGAVASLATVFRYPGVFGGAVLQSGSFILDEASLQGRQHPVFQRVARLIRAVRRVPVKPHFRAFVSTGELEGLADENAALAALLREYGASVRFESSWDGHHWHNWRDQLRDGLAWVLGNDELQ